MEHGKVTSVTYEDGGVFCNIRAIRVNTEYTKVPVVRSHAGFIQVPEQGQTVTIERLSDGTEFVTGVLGREEQYPDDVKEGEVTLQLDEGTRLSFEKQGDGTHDLHIEASGDLIINGEKYSEHTHDYTWGDTAGSGETGNVN